MTGIPDNAKRVRLAVDVECCDVAYCAGANGWSGPEYPLCNGCNADGTRTVVTDVVVERVPPYFADYLPNHVDPVLWREVPS